MSSLFVPFILCFTVTASLSLGVFTAYAAIAGILHAFGPSAQREPAEVRPRLVLVPSQNHASGD